jgi:hypothetical protein
MDTFTNRYLDAKELNAESLQTRTGLKSTLPKQMPIAWFIPYLEEIGDNEEKLLFVTYLDVFLEYMKDSLQTIEQDQSVYANQIKDVYEILVKKTIYVDLRIFAYDVTQLFLYCNQEWQLSSDAIISFSREVLNEFFINIDANNLVKEREEFLASLFQTEKLFVSSSKRTVERLAEIETRENAILYIEQYLKDELNQEGIEDSESQYDFGEIMGKKIVVSTTFVYDLHFNGRLVDAVDIMTVFQLINCYERIPYVLCTDEKHDKFIKVYTGKTVDQAVPYDRITIEKKRDYRPNTIALTIWLGEGLLETSRKSSFFRLTLNFGTGKAIIKLPSTVTSNYEKRLGEVLHELGEGLSLVEDRTDKAFSRETQLEAPENFVFKEFLFYDLILRHPFFRECFYSEERVMPASRRKHIKLRYMPYLSRDFRKRDNQPVVPHVSFSLSVKYGTETKPKIRVYISNTKEEQASNLLFDLIRCLKFYHVGLTWGDDFEDMPEELRMISDTNGLYENAILDLNEAEKQWRFDQSAKKDAFSDVVRPVKSKTKSEAHRKLMKDFPNIFSTGYHKLCRGKGAPAAYRNSDVALEHAEKLTEVSNIHIVPMPFPVENPTIWLVPSGDGYVHPNVIQNTDPQTADQYPYLPCYTKTPAEKHSLYTALYARTGQTLGIKTDVHIFRTDKFLPPGSKGELDPNFLQLLQLPDAYSFGVVYHPSKNSLIHCAIYATGSSNIYNNSFKTSGAREEIELSNKRRETQVRIIRSDLVQSLKLGLMKQELYDYFDQDIRRDLSDNSRFFDSKLFYRVLEEKYGINIFVFSNAPDENGNRFPQLEIPRCSVYHTREVRRDRKSLLLLKNYGPTLLLALNREPQYEIIQQVDGTMLYGQEITDLCYYIMQETQTVLTWVPEDKDLTLYQGISFMHRFSKQLGDSVISQVIDAAGYTRIINFQHEKGPVSMFVPPSQPLNAPTVKMIDKKYFQIAPKEIRSIFAELGSPTGCAEGQKVGVGVGLWFRYLGMKKGIYVPTKSFRNLGYKVLSTNPYDELEEKKAITDDIIKTKETANFIKQLLVWLFSIHRLSDDPSLETFFTNYISYGNEKDPNYDFDGLVEKLPTMKSTKAAIAYLASVTKGFIVDGTVHCYNDRLTQNVAYFLKTYHEETEGLVIQPANKIKDYFLFRKFYNKDKRVRIFLNHDSFVNWMNEMSESRGRVSKVETEITSRLATRMLPFVMEIEDGYFLVQNISDKELKSPQAIENIGTNWLLNKINSKEYEGDVIPSKLIYVVVKSETAVPANIPEFLKTIKENEPYLRVLRHGNAVEVASLGTWKPAVMLPI